jgi:hypothetical protein
MLGYTVHDLHDMQYAIEEGVFYLPPSGHDDTRLNLQKAWEMIEGLLVEGRV